MVSCELNLTGIADYIANRCSHFHSHPTRTSVPDHAGNTPAIVQNFYESNILRDHTSTDYAAREKSRNIWGEKVSGGINKRGGIKVKKASEVMFTVEGYSLIEISLVLALIAVLGGGVFLLYNNRVAPATWSNSQYNTFNGVLAALNTCKSDRGGTYPAAATAGSIIAPGTTTVTGALSPYVGSNSADIIKWTYQCVSGGTSAVIAIVDSATPNADAEGMLVNKINNAGNGALNAAITGTTDTVVTVTIAGTTCS